VRRELRRRELPGDAQLSPPHVPAHDTSFAMAIEIVTSIMIIKLFMIPGSASRRTHVDIRSLHPAHRTLCPSLYRTPPFLLWPYQTSTRASRPDLPLSLSLPMKDPLTSRNTSQQSSKTSSPSSPHLRTPPNSSNWHYGIQQVKRISIDYAL
jgi:hypothetical protein